jgi:phosphotransferase system HPr-like phosphotransfer protein
MGILQGTVIKLMADGPDEKEAVDGLIEVLAAEIPN